MENEHKVSDCPPSALLDTRRAAEFLDVSEPYLIGLIEEGAMPCSALGPHRGINTADLIAFRRVRDGRRAAALDEMARLDAENGLL